MQHAAVHEPMPLGFGLPFKDFDNAAAIASGRPSGLRCKLMCAGLHGQEFSACVWRKVRAGHTLYEQGDALHAIFVVRSGTFKSTLTLVEGSTRICAFPMGGDVIALDGLGRATYATTMTALDDAQVCTIAGIPHVQTAGHGLEWHGQLDRLMGDEILRAQKVLVLMGGTCAQDRLGVFLMDLSQRYRARGYSGRDFSLRMTRSDIGSFLGMALETVSRSFSALQEQGFIEITSRRIQILDLDTFSKRYGAWL